LARATVAASTVTEISIGMLKNGYSPSEINQVRSAFKDTVRSQDPGYLAGKLKSDVARGYRAGDVQRGMSGSDHGNSGSMGSWKWRKRFRWTGKITLVRLTIKLTLFNTKLFWHHPICQQI